MWTFIRVAVSTLLAGIVALFGLAGDVWLAGRDLAPPPAQISDALVSTPPDGPAIAAQGSIAPLPGASSGGPAGLDPSGVGVEPPRPGAERLPSDPPAAAPPGLREPERGRDPDDPAGPERVPDDVVRNEVVRNVGDLIEWRGRWVMTRLFDNDLLLTEGAVPGEGRVTVVGDGRFHSPHFLAVDAEDRLLVTNGWGDSVLLIDQIDDPATWIELTRPGDGLDAPHGLCVAGDTLVVADSLNSRIVRFSPLSSAPHGEWETFGDRTSVVGYGRELHCESPDVQLLANTYEARPGVPRVQGVFGNLLRVDWSADLAAEVVHDPTHSVNGVWSGGAEASAPGPIVTLSSGWAGTIGAVSGQGRPGDSPRVGSTGAPLGGDTAVVETTLGASFGVAYGTHHDGERLWVAHYGSLAERGALDRGALVGVLLGGQTPLRSGRPQSTGGPHGESASR